MAGPTDNLPAELASFIESQTAAFVEDGKDPEQAKNMAFRQAHNAGWYRTTGGWSKLGPDRLGKVAMRTAEMQPDGKFVIPDVDVFYPNAVKGSDDSKIFTADDIARAIANTNEGINAGGQRPSLTIDHPGGMKDLLGSKQLSYGAVINPRPSPIGHGWMRADLVDVDPETVQEWRQGRYRGLSAGFVNDASDANLRLGHVALLGAKSQALSHLPEVELFSATECSPQLCFSTEPVKEKVMPNYAGLKSAHEKMVAAYASHEAGAPEAGERLQEAQEELKRAEAEAGTSAVPGAGVKPAVPAAVDQYASGGHVNSGAECAMIGAKRDDTGGEKPKNKADGSKPKNSIYTKSSMKGKWPSEQYTATDGDPGSDPQQATNTGQMIETTIPNEGNVQNLLELPEVKAHFSAQNAKIGDLTKAVRMLTAVNKTRDYEAKCSELKANGCVFDTGDAMATFEAAGDNEAVINYVIKLLSKNKRQSLATGPMTNPADAGTDFSAGNRSGTDEDAAALLNSLGIQVDKKYIKIASAKY